jgi:hypothetical protein
MAVRAFRAFVFLGKVMAVRAFVRAFAMAVRAFAPRAFAHCPVITRTAYEKAVDSTNEFNYKFVVE